MEEFVGDCSIFRFRICFRLNSIGKTGYGKYGYRNARKDLDENKPVRLTLVAIKLFCMACTSACYRPFTLGGGVEIIFHIDFGIYLSIITPSILIQSTRFHTTQTYTPSNDGCFHKLSLFLQSYK